MTEGAAPVKMISFSCPYCGHMNVEDTGIHSVERIDGKLQWVFREMTAQDAQELRETLTDLLGQGDVTPEGAAAAVEPTSSGLAKIIRSFEDHQGLYTFISMLLTILGILIPLWTRDGPPPATQINQVIVEVESGDTSRYPRNDKCYCGSGHKFKKCHGRHPTADPPPGIPKDRPAHG